jgi:hypothetical protein
MEENELERMHIFFQLGHIEPTKIAPHLDFDFFWLGSVPCRTVKVVGMVVGIQVYEKKILYTSQLRLLVLCTVLSTCSVLVDDGTGVLDCSHPQSLPKSLPKEETTTSKYQRPEKIEPPTMPKPITRIGQFVRVQGKVSVVYGFRRQINVQSIGRLLSLPSIGLS